MTETTDQPAPENVSKERMELVEALRHYFMYEEQKNAEKRLDDYVALAAERMNAQKDAEIMALQGEIRRITGHDK